MSDEANTEARRLSRVGGEWLCAPCYDRLTDRVAFGGGGGMPTSVYALEPLTRLVRRLRGVEIRQVEGACETCGRAGWYETTVAKETPR